MNASGQHTERVFKVFSRFIPKNVINDGKSLLIIDFAQSGKTIDEAVPLFQTFLKNIGSSAEVKGFAIIDPGSRVL